MVLGNSVIFIGLHKMPLFWLVIYEGNEEYVQFCSLMIQLTPLLKAAYFV